jgi:hypothetical protein
VHVGGILVTSWKVESSDSERGILESRNVEVGDLKYTE